MSVESERTIGIDGPVAYHLALTLLLSFTKAGECNELFIEQVMLTLLTHVQNRSASTQVLVCTGKGLAPWQLRGAKELIVGRLAEDISVVRLAKECRLLRSYLTKAFKCSTGVLPHEWLMCMRADRVKEPILGNDESPS